MLSLALMACGSGSPANPDDPAGRDGMLQVVGVVALVSGAPATVTLEVTGQFPDVCTHLKDVSVVRERTLIEVSMTTRRSADFCILVYPGPTVVPVSLPGVFAPGDYVAHVNGREVRFSV
jgi:hypothetical protein